MHVPHVSAWPPQAISGLDLASFWRRAQVPVRSLRLAARAGSSRKVARGHASVSSSCPEPDCRETPALISSVNRQAQVRLLQLPRPSCHLRSPAGCRHCIRRAGGNFATSQSGSSRSGIDNKPLDKARPPSRGREPARCLEQIVPGRSHPGTSPYDSDMASREPWCEIPVSIYPSGPQGPISDRLRSPADLAMVRCDIAQGCKDLGPTNGRSDWFLGCSPARMRRLQGIDRSNSSPHSR